MRVVLDTNVVMSAIFFLLVLNGFRGLEIVKPREFRLRYLSKL